MASPDAIWVISDVAPDGTYVATVQAGDDVAVTLPPDRAIAYALAALGAACRAEYDASVFAQLTTLGVTEVHAAGMILDLRKDRPPLDDDATKPLRFEPLVTSAAKEPAVYVELNGERIARWTTEDTRGHAMHVLEVLLGVDLDAAYRKQLVGVIGLDDETARAAVGGLAQHRKGGVANGG